MEKIDFKPAERKVIEDSFKIYNQTLDFVCKLMIAEGRLPDSVSLAVADDRSGFIVQPAPGPVEVIKAG